jgi:hypothetical protein
MARIFCRPGEAVPILNLGDAKSITINVLADGRLEIILTPLSPRHRALMEQMPRQMMAEMPVSQQQ